MQENTAKTAAEWVFVAKSIAQLPGGQAQALRCMARAGMAAQDSEDWIAVAKAWAQDFSDAEMAQQCLEKAESLATNSSDWSRIAQTWEELGYSGQAETAQRRLSRPERTFGLSNNEPEVVCPSTYDDYTHVESLGTLTAAITRNDAWDTYSHSKNRPASYARFYSFTIPLETVVTIDLASIVDTYLFLLDGGNFNGLVLDQNDDGPNSTDSRITRRLRAGTYTVEATTFRSAEIGNFVLKITPSFSYTPASRSVSRNFRSLDVASDDHVEELLDDDEDYLSPFRRLRNMFGDSDHIDWEWIAVLWEKIRYE